MNEYTRGVLAAVRENPRRGASGQALQIDTSDEALCERLRKLRDALEFPDIAVQGDSKAAQVDILVEALLASEGELVYPGALFIAQADLPHLSFMRWVEACQLICEVEGVEVIPIPFAPDCKGPECMGECDHDHES